MAAGGKLYGPSNITLLLQNERLPSSSDVLNSLWPHTSNPTFPGSKSMGNCNTERVRGRGWRVEGVEKEEEEYEGWFHQQGKKRRLRREQVQFLEKNFEVENKLEPERKVQLAKELGLQPRQVAIWFQNRRARFKTKQLEKEYATLKASYDQLKADYETLVKENYRFKQEVNSLNNRLIGREGEKEKDDFHSSPNNINNDDDDAETEAEAEAQVVRTGMWKVQEDANSAKSDVLDNSEETEANHHSSWLEVDHSSELISQEEEDNLSRDLLTLPCFPKDKVDHACYDHPPPHTCSNHIGLPPLEDHTFCFWPY